MLIDWFTVGAQVVNFVILVWLLKHFLYKPILDAIDAREQHIATVTAEANALKSAATHDREQLQQKSDSFDQERAGLLAKATEEAQTVRIRLLDDAKAAAAALTEKKRQSLLNEAQNLQDAIARRTQQEVFAIARKALSDLSGASLEERCVAAFTQRLRAMQDQARSGLAAAIKSATTPALVRSAFELPAAQRASLQNGINVTFSADVPLRFETEPNLIGGIELSVGGIKVAWSIADYLAQMERAVAALLTGRPQTTTPASGAGTDDRAA